MRQPMWKAFEYQRQLEGLRPQDEADAAPVSTFEIHATPAEEIGCDDGRVDGAVENAVVDPHSGSEDPDETSETDEKIANTHAAAPGWRKKKSNLFAHNMIRRLT